MAQGTGDADRRRGLNRVNVRSVALPVEHGGWSFLAEPLVLGLLVAPSVAGFAIAVATSAGFLIRHPGRMFWKNRQRLDVSPRYGLARKFAAGYSLVAAAGLGTAWALAGIRPLVPFIIAGPFFLLFAVYDVRHEARLLLPELLAPAAVAVSAPAIALAGGWTAQAALVLWVLLVLRFIPTVLYIRARLRLERDKPHEAAASNTAHGAAVLAGGGLAGAGLAPWLSVVGLGVLLVRAVVGLSRYHRPATAKVIGFSEVAYGSLFVLLTAVGYWILG
jgi:hypothetical protein